ncbi:MAG: M48 family metalloprotease [Gallionellaceae bacterium]|nr:M48 family metalloprotease [Gallionellaceae bacterium]
MIRLLRNKPSVRYACFAVLACLSLSACTTSRDNGRLQITAPPSVSAVYSEVNLKLSLVSENDINTPCTGATCKLDRAFDQSVLRLGTKLARTAFDAYPDLSSRFDKFEFVIAEKAGPGSISNATGTVVIFRGTQDLRLGDEALAFLIAREMGHVISRHHDENSATNIIFSVLAALIMPVSNLISGSAALTQSFTTTATTSAATSAASFVGTKITIESYKPEQLHEANVVAVNLLGKMGWSRKNIADALVTATRVLSDDKWSNELRASAEDIAVMADSSKNSIIELDVDKMANGDTVIKVGLLHPLRVQPPSFITGNPPRIALELINTRNDLGRPAKTFPGIDVRKISLIQEANNTQLTISLGRMLSYETRVKGNALLITLRDKISPGYMSSLGEAGGVTLR